MLKADNLVKSFYKTEAKGKRVEFNAVDGISISVETGEILGILGPNGAGKTTLLRMLSGLMEPTSGEVSVTGKNGETVNDTLEVKKSIGYLSGNTKLYGRMSVRELLKIFGAMYEIEDKVLNERIDKITEVLGMEEFVDNRIERLSTGQTQRASIARTIIHDPDIYIFDEPTLGLDIISSSAIIEFMKKEKERGKTVIYSTHYMEEADYLCDRIVMLNKGKTICDASPEDLKKQNGVSSMRDAFYRIIESEGISYEV